MFAEKLTELDMFEPNVQAQMSEFSFPVFDPVALSQKAFSSGSVIVSSSSCCSTEIMASTPGFPFGEVAPGWPLQLAKLAPAGLPTNEYFRRVEGAAARLR